MEWVLVEEKVYVPKKLKEAASNLRFQMVLEFLTQPLIYHMRQSLVLFHKFHANTWTVGRHGHLTVHNLDAVESVVGDEPVAIKVSPVAEWRKLSRSGHGA